MIESLPQARFASFRSRRSFASAARDASRWRRERAQLRGVAGVCARIERHSSRLPRSGATICNRKLLALRWASPIFGEILLAALLIMCNAAEKFCALVANLANGARFLMESKFFESLGLPGDANSPPEIFPTVESPVATGRVLCLLL
jgi:hypothetical protein